MRLGGAAVEEEVEDGAVMRTRGGATSGRGGAVGDEEVEGDVDGARQSSEGGSEQRRSWASACAAGEMEQATGRRRGWAPASGA